MGSETDYSCELSAARVAAVAQSLVAIVSSLNPKAAYDTPISPRDSSRELRRAGPGAAVPDYRYRDVPMVSGFTNS